MVHILANHSDFDGRLGRPDHLRHLYPCCQVRLRALNPKVTGDVVAQSLSFQNLRHSVYGVESFKSDYGFDRYVTVKRDLAACFLGNLEVAPANNGVRLNSHAPERLNAVLSRLGL